MGKFFFCFPLRRAVFPNVDEKIIERKDGNKDIQFSGFSKRQTPLPFAITWQGMYIWGHSK